MAYPLGRLVLPLSLTQLLLQPLLLLSIPLQLLLDRQHLQSSYGSNRLIPSQSGYPWERRWRITAATSAVSLLQSNRQSLPLQRQTDNVSDRHLEHREAAHAGVASRLAFYWERYAQLVKRFTEVGIVRTVYTAASVKKLWTANLFSEYPTFTSLPLGMKSSTTCPGFREEPGAKQRKQRKQRWKKDLIRENTACLCYQ